MTRDELFAGLLDLCQLYGTVNEETDAALKGAISTICRPGPMDEGRWLVITLPFCCCPGDYLEATGGLHLWDMCELRDNAPKAARYALALIRADQRDGLVPAGVTSWAELGQHVDAEDYLRHLPYGAPIAPTVRGLVTAELAEQAK